MYFSAVPVATLFILLWNPPAGWSNTALLVYLMVVFVAARFCITLYEIPSSALVAELTDQYDERTRLLSWRYLFGVLGSVGATVIAYRLFLVKDAAHPVGVLNRGGYGHFAFAAAAVMVTSILISAAGTHNRIRYLRRLAPREPLKLAATLREMRESFSNHSFIVVTLAALFSSMAGGLTAGLGVYFNFYLWGFSTQQTSILALALAVAVLVSVASAAPLSARMGKRNACIATAIGSVVSGNAVYLFKLAGLMPPDGSSALMGIIFASLTVSLALGFIALILYSSMIADVVEDSQLKTGRRSEGLFFAASSFIQKAVSGMGLFLSSLLLAWVHFPAKAKPGAVDPLIIRHLVETYIPILGVLYAITVTLLFAYRINRDSHQDNLRRISDAAAAIEQFEGGDESALRPR
jgi:Na+/melibiose symporter-like transporter